MTLSIPAKVWADSHESSAEFDALPWFKQASDKEIKDLANIHWREDFAADAVAEYMIPHDKGVADVFGFANRVHGTPAYKDRDGFEVSVDSEAALAWLKTNRFTVYLDVADIDPENLIYTDYPFVELGDTPGETAPVRRVQLLAFDGNKYARILAEGKEVEVKYSYLYATRSHAAEDTFIPLDKVEKLTR
ncbi:hypothetical protein [Neptuniibacter sp. QD37_11]|uniref:hypothetical protein n=1 Tax=Neptuniibacter sp. QD37_11 TaxID=3398209 RepID=UPI0039F57C82